MTTEDIIKKTLGNKGNYCRGNGDIYISPMNMGNFVNYLDDCDDVPSVLITPYLINTEDDDLYELHYYEFELEAQDTAQSYFVEHQEGNVLPEEIVKSIKPKVIIAKNDKAFLIKSLHNYLKSMERMDFEQDRNNNKRLEKAVLFYQIF
ncbi:MAG: hypothetical protein FWH55_04765 [Oscillospiraceae bacterium]|nr:hypothetical protein [Oscillospiraceae bacterium]